VTGITVWQAYSVDGRYTEILVAAYPINSIASRGDISKIDNIMCHRGLQLTTRIMTVIIIIKKYLYSEYRDEYRDYSVISRTHNLNRKQIGT